VLTIGKFDGVHLGHQAVLYQLREKAQQLNVPCVVMVFEPQPEEVFMPDSAPARLSTLRDKASLLAKLGIQRLICIRFNEAFAAQTPETFIHDLLVKKLGVQFLVVGDDFKFGCKRAGDFSMLQRAGRNEGFDVVSTASFRLKESRISSTAIRQALSSNDFELAKNMLGRDFAFSGKVIHGNKKGRTIGFPTANLLVNRVRTPIRGVFAVKVTIQSTCFYGVANIGCRPTINGERLQLEVHVFDFKQHIYGQRIDVAPVFKIREERKFASFDDLKAQIFLDAQTAKQKLNAMFADVITES
jgi:riboflavin kinase/FMN adenylyltransferase